MRTNTHTHTHTHTHSIVFFFMCIIITRHGGKQCRCHPASAPGQAVGAVDANETSDHALKELHLDRRDSESVSRKRARPQITIP